MATVSTGPLKPALSLGNAADVISINAPINQLRLINKHATQTVALRMYFGETEAQAAANAVAANVAAAQTATLVGSFSLAAAQTDGTVVFKSKRKLYCAFTFIASGAATTVDVVGTTFTQGQ